MEVRCEELTKQNAVLHEQMGKVSCNNTRWKVKNIQFGERILLRIITRLVGDLKISQNESDFWKAYVEGIWNHLKISRVCRVFVRQHLDFQYSLW